MAGEYVEFDNNSQPALNDENLNLMQQLIKQDIQGAVSGDTLPVGTIVPFGSNTIPDNWLLCDGSAVSRTTYQTLFNTIGTSYGQGDGFTTFNLPDLRGKVGVGKSSDREFDTLGGTGGSKTNKLDLPNYAYKVYNTDENYANNELSGHWSPEGIQYGWGSNYSTNKNTPVNNLQPYIVINYIIKAYQSSGVVATVVDNLNSDSAINALSAKQGKLLGQYSTNETVVGTWIDGKPLYRKVIDTGVLPDASDKNVPTGLSASNTFVVKTYGMAYRSSDNAFYPMPLASTNSLNSIQLLAVTVDNIINVRIITGTDRSNMQNSYVTLEYTKTTD